MPELLTVAQDTIGDIDMLGRLLAEAYERRVDWYRKEYKLSRPDAEARVAEAGTPAYHERALTDPAERVTFHSLHGLHQHAPDQALVAWERVKQAARDDLANGHRAADMLAARGDAWDKAQFLAVRAAFRDQWQPTNAGEQLLVDMLAQTYTAYLFWIGLLTTQATTEAAFEEVQRKDRGTWTPMRVSDSQTLDQSAAMADRFNRMFLRTMRQIRDLRRYAPQVTINNPGQVNIGAQQVNAAQVRFEKDEDDAE